MVHCTETKMAGRSGRHWAAWNETPPKTDPVLLLFSSFRPFSLVRGRRLADSCPRIVNDPDYRASLKDFDSFIEKLSEKVIEADETVPELPMKDIVSLLDSAIPSLGCGSHNSDRPGPSYCDLHAADSPRTDLSDSSRRAVQQRPNALQGKIHRITRRPRWLPCHLFRVLITSLDCIRSSVVSLSLVYHSQGCQAQY